MKPAGICTRFMNLLMPLVLAAAILPAQEMPVDLAWQALAENNQQRAESFFRAAIAKDSSDTRAYIGLSLLFDMQNKPEESWTVFSKLLQLAPDICPYVYASKHSEKLTSGEAYEAEIVALYERLSTRADDSGVLKAMAHEFLASYYLSKKDQSRASAHFDSMHIVADWQLIGPFDNISASGFARAYPPEREFKPEQSYAGKGDIPVDWFRITRYRPDRWIDFTSYYPYSNALFYANTFIYSPTARKVHIRIGTSGHLKAFLNDALILACFDENNNDLDTYVAETELSPGWNRLLVKCGYSEIDRCNFMVRVVNEYGEAFSDLKISAQAHGYTPRTGLSVRLVENFAEVFFKEAIRNQPHHLENYVLLADCYLRNDKAIEAELTLRKGLQLAPECALLLTHLLEAFIRGEKQDELQTTIEKIYTLDKKIPFVCSTKIHGYLESGEIDKAEALLGEFRQDAPGSKEVYSLEIALANKKDQIDQILATLQEGYEKYPTEWSLVFLHAFLLSQTKKDYYGAAEVIEKYLDQNYNSDALKLLANIYQQAGRISKWQEVYDKILALDPTDISACRMLAQNLLQVSDTEGAEAALQRTLEVTRYNPLVWAELGNVYRAGNKKEEARKAYTQALRLNPMDYDAREALRAIEGRKDPFAVFTAFSIDSLVKNSPGQVDYPNDDTIVLLEDMKRVVYPGGASETQEEWLVKVLTQNGTDLMKEFVVDYNPYSQTLQIEKAVVLKADGSEVKADAERNQLIFKTLAPGDYVWIRWRIKNQYFGALAHHFWDTFYINSFHPVKLVRYALIAPKEMTFNFRLQNATQPPQKVLLPEGVLHQWLFRDQPAIQYEYGMPGLDDIGRILYVSSVGSWQTIAETYDDWTREKTRSSWEIQEQVRTLFAGRPELDEDSRIRLIHDFIKENIRYSDVSLRQSPLIPQKARDVLVNKIGDCKDMSTLFIAMLKEAGIKAYYLLLNTRTEGQNRNALPALAFNHCITAVARAGGELQYLDLTPTDLAMDVMPPANFDAFALLVKPDSKEPFFLSSPRFIPYTVTRKIAAEFQPDNTIVCEVATVKRGGAGSYIRSSYRGKAQSEKERIYLQALSEDNPDVRLKHFEIDDLEELSPTVRYRFVSELPDYLLESGQFRFFTFPWQDECETRNALSYDKRTYPFNSWMGEDSSLQEISLRLPQGFEPVEALSEKSFSCPYGSYRLTFATEGETMRATRLLINSRQNVPPEAYLEYKNFWNRAVKEDARQILLKPREAGDANDGTH